MILETFKLKCFSNYLDTEVRCFMKTSTFNILLISLNVVEVSLKSVIELRNTLKYLHSGVGNFITVFQTRNRLIKNVEQYNNEDNQKNSTLHTNFITFLGSPYTKEYEISTPNKMTYQQYIPVNFLQHLTPISFVFQRDFFIKIRETHVTE